MELKVGREYRDEDGETKCKILEIDGENIYALFRDGSFGRHDISNFDTDTLLPPSTEYLKGINQPFGTLDEDVQEALKMYVGNHQSYNGAWGNAITPQWDRNTSYRLRKDYVEKPEYEPRSFKNTKVRVYNDELSAAVQESLFKLGYRWLYSGNDLIPAYRYIMISSDNTIHDTLLRYFIDNEHEEVQAHEILDEARKL